MVSAAAVRNGNIDVYLFKVFLKGTRVRSEKHTRAAKIDGFAKRSENPKHFESEQKVTKAKSSVYNDKLASERFVY